MLCDIRSVQLCKLYFGYKTIFRILKMLVKIISDSLVLRVFASKIRRLFDVIFQLPKLGNTMIIFHLSEAKFFEQVKSYEFTRIPCCLVEMKVKFTKTIGTS